MNSYIKTDIEQGLQYLKVGVMNTLADIESGEENEIVLNGPIALQFIIDCAKERGWANDPDMDWDWTNGWEVDYWYHMITPNQKRVVISSALLEGRKVKLRVCDDE